MAVDVEDGLDAGVSESGGDDGGVGTLGDEEGDVAVAEVVEPHGLADRVCDGGEPEAAAERVAADGSAFGGGEDQAVRGRAGGRSRCRSMVSGSHSGSDTARRAAAVFGCPKRRWPRTSARDRSMRMIRLSGW